MHENRETSEMLAARERCRTAGKGHGHTTRMHVSEESDSGILPMNHSKEDGRKRPLGVAAVEDKTVQQAVVTILNQIYEEDFLGFSYGFRPGRNQHQALDALSYALLRMKVNYVLDADIRGFFDNLDKSWLIKFVEHRVADPRILRLIQKWLNAGVMEEGKWSETKTGTPQGSVITPLTQKV